MAAGLVYHNITTASGITFTVASWVPDTSAPDVGAFPVQVPVNSSGVPVPSDATNGLDVDVTRIQSQAFMASATFTPAATSHTGSSATSTGDCNGAAQQFTFSPAPVSGSFIRITDIECEIDSATAETSPLVLALFNVTPPSAIADDGVFDLASGDRATFLGFIDIGVPVDRGATQWCEVHGINKVVKLAGTTVFGYLLNTTTQTPAAVAHITKIYGEPT